MKKNFILNGLVAIATLLAFTQCSNKATDATAPVPSGVANGLKIAFIEIDSLLTNYNFAKDLNEMMIKKEENIRTTLNEKAKKLDADAKEFQRKYENNGFVSQERAQQEYNRIQKMQAELQEKQQQYQQEFALENQKNNLALRDSISAFLKIYNQDKGYDLILSNSGLDNLLYGNPAYNITQEIIDGLNANYSPASKK